MTPGRREKAPEKPPDLAAPPSLSAAANAPEVAHFNANPMPNAGRPRLALPAARTVPVRAPDLPTEGAHLPPEAIASALGQSANLIILSASTAKEKELVTVPPGSNTTDTGPVSQAHSGTGTGSGRVRNSTNGAGYATAASVGSAAIVPLPGAAGTSPPGALPVPRPNPVVPPKPGTFDIVVVQSAVNDKLFRSVGILKGKPVYTVYLQLGAPKAWILQFCLAAHSAAAANGGIVSLEDPKPLTPPYPVTTVLSDLELQPKSTYTMVHGFLTTAGKFRNLALVGRADEQTSHLLEILSQWEFQPAKKDSDAVEIEVLVAIPPVSP